jgi:hypothetical protein
MYTFRGYPRIFMNITTNQEINNSSANNVHIDPNDQTIAYKNAKAFMTEVYAYFKAQQASHINFAITPVYNIAEDSSSHAKRAKDYADRVYRFLLQTLTHGNHYNRARWRQYHPVMWLWFDLPGKGRDRLHPEDMDIWYHRNRLAHHHGILSVHRSTIDKFIPLITANNTVSLPQRFWVNRSSDYAVNCCRPIHVVPIKKDGLWGWINYASELYRRTDYRDGFDVYGSNLAVDLPEWNKNSAGLLLRPPR